MRRVSRVVTALTLLVGAFALVAPSSAAAAEGISLSSDGRSWSTSLAAPLFDDQTVWVPGDSRVATFFVRNDSAAAADLRVDVVTTDPDELIRVGDLEVASRVDAEPWGATSTAGAHELSQTRIATGAVRAVDVRVTLPWSASDRSETLRLDFDIQVTLSHRVFDTLPETGGGPTGGPLLGAIGAIAVGVFLTACTRRSTSRRDRSAPDG